MSMHYWSHLADLCEGLDQRQIMSVYLVYVTLIVVALGDGHYY